MEDLFKVALGIEYPWFISNLSFDSDSKRLDVQLSYKRGSHFEVDNTACPVHDTVEKSWRHLNFFEHECHLHARIPRVKTPDGRTIMVTPPWSGKLSGFTLLFEALILQLCKHMPVHQLAKMTGISDYRIWNMLDVYVAAARFDEDWSSVSAIGMDETSVAKGHDYITLFVDMNQRRTLHVAEGKGHETVAEFVTQLNEHQGNSKQIEQVSCDMSPAFIKGVREFLPNAAITFDKFHVAKIINEGVDWVRREEAKTNPLLKNSRFVFLKNDANLTVKQRKKKEELQISELNLNSMEALRMRENFQQIYHAKTALSFVKLLNDWVKWVEKCGLKPMEKVANTIARHIDGILQWKTSQLNNGILEGLNSVIQAAKRKARGYKKKHFATIAHLITGKLNLSAINSKYKPT